MRILVASDAPWASSGYSNQVRQFAPAIRDLGHHVAFLATYGLQGGRLSYQDMPVYPGGADPFANDVIPQAARDWQADVVITLKDSFVFKPEAFQGLRWCGMIPVDHDPTPSPVVGVARAMYRPIAYAPHGFKALRLAGLDPLYAPHSYDPAIMRPMPKDEARKALGIPDGLFIVGTVAVNRGGIPSRKAWPQNLEAFARFAADKPNARYFLHTYLGQDGFEGSVNLPALCAQLGITEKVLFCDQDKYKAGFSDEYLRVFYSALDVLNAVSVGEGFGIPTLEAQACGSPVIVGDWCAQEDLCFAGWKVSKAAALKFYDAQGSWVYIPQPQAIADAMQGAYTAAHGLRAAAVAGAAHYALPNVMQTYWKPLLDELEHSIARETSRGVLRIVRPEEVGVAA